jgi:hypothetical protein
MRRTNKERTPSHLLVHHAREQHLTGPKLVCVERGLNKQDPRMAVDGRCGVLLAHGVEPVAYGAQRVLKAALDEKEVCFDENSPQLRL